MHIACIFFQQLHVLYLGGKMELRMSSVCVMPFFCSTGRSVPCNGGSAAYSPVIGPRKPAVMGCTFDCTFLPALSFGSLPLSFDELTSVGLSYLTSDCI